MTNVSKYDVGPLVPLKQRGLTSGPGRYVLSGVLEPVRIKSSFFYLCLFIFGPVQPYINPSKAVSQESHPSLS